MACDYKRRNWVCKKIIVYTYTQSHRGSGSCSEHNESMQRLPSGSQVNSDIIILPQILRWLYKTSQTTPILLTGSCQHSAHGLLSSRSKQYTFLRALWLAHFAPGSMCTCNFCGCQSRPLAGGLGVQVLLGPLFPSLLEPLTTPASGPSQLSKPVQLKPPLSWLSSLGLSKKVSSFFLPVLAFTN